jgi:uncharacterized cupin superfamily protein
MNEIVVIPDAYEKAKELGMEQWGHWECEPSVFDWFYDAQETAYVFEGRVIVTTENQRVEIGPGMLVSFPKGLACTWDVRETIKKAYAFDVNINQARTG